MSAELWLLGTPLDDRQAVGAAAKKAVEDASVVIGETRSVSLRFLREVKTLKEKQVFFLDPMSPRDKKDMEEALTALGKKGGAAVLFSDGGMPVLFDPGREILELCRGLGFRIRSTEGATSWGMACALSGLLPPFLVFGFLPREKADRESQLKALAPQSAHLVLMDTPYRFELLLEQASRELGGGRRAFLAWELTKPEEALLWGTLSELREQAKRLGLRKGEFILIVEKK